MHMYNVQRPNVHHRIVPESEKRSTMSYSSEERVVCEGEMVIILSERSKFRGQYAFVYREFEGGRFGVVVPPQSRKIVYTKKNLDVIRRYDNGIRLNSFDHVKRVRDKYYTDLHIPDQLSEDEDAPEPYPTSSSASQQQLNHGQMMRRLRNNSTFDMEALSSVLQGLQESVDNLAESTRANVSSLLNRMNRVENTLDALDARANPAPIPLNVPDSVPIIPDDNSDSYMGSQ